MTPLELLRHEQHNDDVLPADVELAMYLGGLTRAQAIRDLTRGFSHDEKALYRMQRHVA